ncbi:MAG: HNH endonuclease [Gemmataceae bacterium]|nr:HNH endonuclease [Gemmataceae bacterium]
MTQVEAYRQIVEARAGGACEYCRLLQAATGVTFHIEHFVPRSRGGLTVMSNLVLSCPGCNLSKADRASGEDQSGVTQSLFNPRDYEPSILGWHLHFSLDGDTGIISPRTSIGEATVNTLRINDPNRVFARKLQIFVGLIA